MSASERQSIEKAIGELAHHDPAARFRARQFLIERKELALPLVQKSLEGSEKLSADFQQELVRVRNWIVYGEDPERLNGLIQALDLRRIEHGNMFGGMAGAIEAAPEYKEFLEIGKRVLPFTREVLENDENSYSIRAAAVMLLRESGTIHDVPMLVAVLEREHLVLSETNEAALKLEENYRGFFIDVIHEALTHFTGEFFPLGLFQTFLSGNPEAIYYVSVSGNTLQRWRDWWEKMGPQIESGNDAADAPADSKLIDNLLVELTNSKDNYERYALNRIGAKADQKVVEFILARPTNDTVAASLVEMLIQNGRGSSMVEGEHTAEAIVFWLTSLHDILLFRDALTRSYAQLPASTLRAISLAFPTHVLAQEYSHLFDPYGVTQMDQLRMRLPYSETATEEIIRGLLSSERSVRHLFFDIAQGAALQVSSKRQSSADESLPPHPLTVRLLQVRDSFTDFEDRAAMMKTLERLGIAPELEQILEALSSAQPESSNESLAQLIEMLPAKQVPEAQRPVVLRQMFKLVKSRPALSTGILRILNDLAPEYFQFFPAIGPEGVSGLVQIYELTNKDTGTPNKEELAAALQSYRRDVHTHAMQGGMFERFLGASAIRVSSKFARRFELPAELFDSLTHEATILAQNILIGYPEFETFKSDLDTVIGSSECAYLECLKDKEEYEEPTSYDLAGCLYEEAARVAANNDLGRDKIIVSQLSVADMARKAKRYDYAEKIYLELDLKETDNPTFITLQKHFYSELLVQQGRWADAGEVALELRALLAQQELSSQEQWHYYGDTYLHEFFCCCRFENFGKAMSFFQPLTSNYEKLGILQHYAEVLIEGASIFGKFGRHADAELQFKNIHEILPGDAMAGPTRLTLLRHEAQYLLSIGNTEGALDLLDRARLLWETLPKLDNRPYEKIAEVVWLMGQVQLMKGDAERASQALRQLREWSQSPLVQIYRARLQAKIEASFGSIAAAITTLQEAVQLLPPNKAYPDLKVELCLDLCELLILEGFHERSLAVLNDAYRIAAESRNPHLMAIIRIMEGQVFENAGNLEKASAIYRELIISEQAAEIPDLVAVAGLNIQALFARQEGNIDLANDVDGIGKALLAIQNVRLRISSLQRFARLYLANNRPAFADFMLNLLDNEIKTGIPLNVVLECKMLHGQSARLNGRAEEAVGYYREAVNILEVVHSSVLERGLGAGVFVSKDSPYRALVQALVDAGKNSEALHYVERAKTRLFLDQIHWRVINNYEETNPLVRYLQILKQLSFLELQTDRPAGKDRSDERTSLERELETLRATIPEHDLIAAVYPVLGGPVDTLRDLKSVLQRNEVEEKHTTANMRMVLAEYFMTDEALLLFVLRDDFNEPEVVTIDRRPAEMQEFVKQSFQAETGAEGRVLRSTGEKVRRLDEDAFQAFLAPLVAPLEAFSNNGKPRTNEGDVIWLVPYDVLHYLPLHALKVNGRYLIERNPVVYSPSASIMKYCQLNESGGRSSALVVGDSFDDLPHAREEARTVSRLFGTEPLLGSAATKPAVTDLIQQSQQSIDVLHFSCHGYFDTLEALKSGIKLAPGKNQAIDQQSNLTAEDIFNIQLSAGLVTLSACETGVSEQRHGDELIGLTRALIHAGIPAVIVSLWTVNDTSTSLLMHEFYSKFRESTSADGSLISKVAALQSAQTYLLNLTAKDCIEYCDRRLNELNGPDDLSRAIRYRLDRASFHVLAGDLETAMVEYQQIRQHLVQTQDEWAVQLRDQIDRRLPVIKIKSEEDPGTKDFTVRVYQRIYHWAPFVLVGDWR